MRMIFLILFFSSLVMAQSPSPSAQPSAPPTIAPVAISIDVVPKAIEPPPEWIKATIESIYSLPIVGPYAAKGVQWLGVLAVIMTAFTGAIMISIQALMSVLNFAGLAVAVSWLNKFNGGKIMYWLKYFSMFNAQKK